MSKDKSIEVYFNSACPVCKAGIEYQRKKATAADVDWLDIHVQAELCDRLTNDHNTVRKYLHIRDKQGQQKIGINAFIELWRASPSQHWMAVFFALPLINQVSQMCYFLFANALYGWNRLLKRW